MTERFSDSQGAREALSALADGEAPLTDVSKACAAWREGEGARATWHAYHVIGDVMRSDDLAHASDGGAFLAKFRDRLAQEPVVLAPQAGVETKVAQASAAAQSSAGSAPVSALKRRAWAGPMAVAAGFVMVVGAVVSGQMGVSSGGGDAGRQMSQVTPAGRQQVLTPAGDGSAIALASANSAVLAGMPVQSSSGVSVEGASFSRPDPAAPVLIRDPQVDQLLATLPRHGNAAEASFASQGGLARNAAFELP